MTAADRRRREQVSGGPGLETTAPAAGREALLERVLEPLSRHYGDPATVEIRMNAPGRVVADRRGAGKRLAATPGPDVAGLESICKALANRHGLPFDPDDHPRLGCVLPGGHRFECLLGASAQSGVSLAIRCKHPFAPTWEQLGADGAVRAYLEAAVAAGRNLIVSGATNTGKTTLLNKLLSTLPADRRVVALEDAPELRLERFWDGIGLLSEREPGDRSGMLGWRQLYDHLVRVTPDHVLFGEIGTRNAFAAMAALNSGATGFMCTIHAESPRQAIHRKFDQNVAWSGEAMPRVAAFLTELVDVVVQVRRDADGFRRVCEIWEPKTDRRVLAGGADFRPPNDNHPKAGNPPCG